MAKSILVQHWRQLDGSVHPSDAPVFESCEHRFNLDWPPPAYIGDIENSPFVLLMMNGGYDPKITPTEFPDQTAVQRYLEYLHDPRPINPKSISPYYDAGNYGHHIESGRLALVNAVAYRSGKLSAERDNARLAERLPSTLLHRRWLREELAPQALAGDRVIIAHRNGMWKIRQHEYQHPNIIFTNSGASPYLPRQVLDLLSG